MYIEMKNLKRKKKKKRFFVEIRKNEMKSMKKRKNFNTIFV